MAEEKKRILIVDDHYDTLRFLRTLLEMADERYKVTSVLSGEEAGLELRQAYDLLITDIKLPGVDGIQVAQRARRLAPTMPIIVISGFPKEIVRLEQTDLSVVRTFRKPLIAEEVLEAVHIALFGVPPKPPEPEPEPELLSTAVVEQLIIDSAVPAEVHKRLELLRANTGADELMLVTLNGDISAESGILDMSVPAIAQTIALNLRGSFALADQLGHPEGHQSIQYHNTARYDIYTANVGEYHFVTMFFDTTKTQRGRIGTVWVFVQRAIKELAPLLTHVKVRKEKVVQPVPPAPVAPPEPVATAADMPLPAAPTPAPAPTPLSEPKQPRSRLRMGEAFTRAAAVSRAEVEAEATSKTITPEEKPAAPAPAPAFYVPPPVVELEPLSDADMAKLAALDVGDDDSADDFWSSATNLLQTEEPLTGGVSLEEALRQGVLPVGVAENSPLASLLEEKELSTAVATAPATLPPVTAIDIPPATDIPADLLAPADDFSDFSLDLGPMDEEDEDDFDLSDMPGLAGLEALGDEASAHPHHLRDEDMAKLASLEISDTAESSEVEAFWNALLTGDTSKGARSDGLTFDEAVAQGLAIEEKVEHVVHPTAKAEPVAASLAELAAALGTNEDEEGEAFWDTLATQPTSAPASSTDGMSLEEAIRKGLLPATFKLNDG